MEYTKGQPVTKPKRAARRREQPKRINRDHEANRQRAQQGGQANEIGVVQGQNGEQGNAENPTFSERIGRPGEE